MAMNIISKEKKEIKWVGLPTNSAQECQQLEVGMHKMLLEFVWVHLSLKLVNRRLSKVSLTHDMFVPCRRKRKKDKKE